MKMIRYSGSMARTVRRGNPIGYPSGASLPPVTPTIAYVWNGIDSFAQAVTRWEAPTAGQWRISAKWIWADGTTFPVQKDFIGAFAVGTPLFSGATSGRFISRYTAAAGAQFPSPDPVMTGGYIYSGVVHATDTTVSATLNGIGGTGSVVAQPATTQTQNIQRVNGVGSVFHAMAVAHLYCENLLDPTDSVYWPMDEGAGTTFLAYQDPTLTVLKTPYNMGITAGTGGAGTGWQPVTATYPPTYVQALPA